MEMLCPRLYGTSIGCMVHQSYINWYHFPGVYSGLVDGGVGRMQICCEYGNRGKLALVTLPMNCHPHQKYFCPHAKKIPINVLPLFIFCSQISTLTLILIKMGMEHSRDNKKQGPPPSQQKQTSNK